MSEQPRKQGFTSEMGRKKDLIGSVFRSLCSGSRTMTSFGYSETGPIGLAQIMSRLADGHFHRSLPQRGRFTICEGRPLAEGQIQHRRWLQINMAFRQSHTKRSTKPTALPQATVTKGVALRSSDYLRRRRTSPSRNAPNPNNVTLEGSGTACAPTSLPNAFDRTRKSANATSPLQSKSPSS